MASHHLLEGRVAIISGGGGEIGGAMSSLFAHEGARVFVLDISLEKAQATADAIAADGGEAVAFAADITDPAQAQGLDHWNRAWAVNVTGAFLMCKYTIPEMRRAGGGAIVNIASSHAHIGVPQRPAYCATKGAVLQLTKVLAIDHAGDGIRANSISPGAIDTLRAALQRFPSREAANAAKGPSYLLNRTGQAREIADGALYLASDLSSFVTGTDLLIDGGYLAFKGSLTHPA